MIKLYELCHEAVIMLCLFFAVLWLGLQCDCGSSWSYSFFKLTFSIQFLKVVRQEQQNFSDEVHCHLFEF